MKAPCPKCGRNMMEIRNQKGYVYEHFCHWCGVAYEFSSDVCIKCGSKGYHGTLINGLCLDCYVTINHI